MHKITRVGLAQIKLSQLLSLPTFLRCIDEYLHEAVQNCCDLILLPEYFNLDLLPRDKPAAEGIRQIARYAPSIIDKDFPEDGNAAIANCNSEEIIIKSLDLSLLEKLTTQGTVQNRVDRRQDLYKILKNNSQAENPFQLNIL